MTLPWKVRAIIAVALIGGWATLAIAVEQVPTTAPLTAGQWAALAVTSALMCASWIHPALLYRGDESEAFHLDEAFFVLLVLIEPAVAVIGAFAVTTAVAQLVKRRALAKSVFNVGQMTIAVGLGTALVHAVSDQGGRPTGGALLAALGGATVCFLVNGVSVAAILVAMGATWRECLLDGLDLRVSIGAAGAIVGSALALAVSSRPWAVSLEAAVLLTMRRLLGGHFGAQHDRARVQGLFEETLAANGRLGHDDVMATILDAARRLLRCPEATVQDDPPGAGQIGARLSVDGRTQWLVVAGRRRDEPFEPADAALLEALGAVGSGALTNAALYHQVRFEQDRLSNITLAIGEGVCALDAYGLLTFVNPAAAELLGVPATSAAPDPAGRPPAPAPGFLVAPARLAMATGQIVRDDDATFVGSSGQRLPVAYSASPIAGSDGPAGAVVAFRDITERKAFEDEMTLRALYDPLTGLANRRLLVDELEGAIERSAVDGSTSALLFIDVDRFKNINDSLGHGVGDDLLIAIARRLRAATRLGDVLARLGGDEFVLLLQDIASVDDAVATALRITEMMEQPVCLRAQHEIVASVSIGIALTGEGRSGDDVLRDADVAMYQAKGRTAAWQVFDMAAMGNRSPERIDLEAALRAGLQRGELDVWYQPFFAINDGRLVGAEALVRWRHPTRGLLSPAHFIGMAEDTGLILPLGRFVLEQACGQARRVRDRLGIDLSMNVNLSARQFQNPGLLSEVTRSLATAGLDAAQIVLEITETMVMDDVDHTKTVLEKLKALGVRVAIDDFGTGHSSLGYLKHFPVDEVKVDRSFVQGLGHDPVDAAIVAAVIDLARALGIDAVAEGVETAEQLASLEVLGCQIAQGYHFSKPLPAAEFDQLLDLTFGRSLNPA